jgi:acyl-homoserine-lactone acylase
VKSYLQAKETGRATGTRKWYGTRGNSFVAVVEFGNKVRARAVTAGGESGHPSSPHDQVERYITGTCAKCTSILKN